MPARVACESPLVILTDPAEFDAWLESDVESALKATASGL
jgi:hypothetical protein